MRAIWVVAHGPKEAPIAYFSTKESAEQYVQLLVERYSLGKKLAVRGKPLASDAGVWQLGLGPTVLERVMDESTQTLPGAWIVRVDETTRMVSCQFSTQHRVATLPTRFRSGIHAICEACGTTPHVALDRARKAMVSYLSSKPSWR